MPDDTLQMLLKAFNQIAPNEKAQTILAKQVHEAQRANLAEREILLIVTGAIYDGLAYGNWPGVA